jgi:hypothetical protein
VLHPQVLRGQDVVLTYTATARPKPQPNPKVTGFVSVTAKKPYPMGHPPGKCILLDTHNTFPVGLRVTIDGGAPTRVDINFASSCDEFPRIDHWEIICSPVRFEVPAPGQQPSKIAVAPLWQDKTTGAKSAVNLCSAGGQLPINVPEQTDHTATVMQALEFPMWNPIPISTPNQVAGVTPTLDSSGGIATVRSAEPYQAIWTVTFSNIISCASNQQVRRQDAMHVLLVTKSTKFFLLPAFLLDEASIEAC